MKWTQVILWTLATAVTWAIGAIFFPLAYDSISGITPMGNFILFVLWLWAFPVGVIGGFALGLMHWAILRRTYQVGRQWIFATTIGMALGWTVAGYASIYAIFTIDFPPSEELRLRGSELPSLLDLVARGAVVTACVGLVLGIAQWLVLRKHSAKASIWIVVSLVAWILGGILYHYVYVALGGPLASPTYNTGQTWNDFFRVQSLAHWSGWIAGGIAIGAITGIAVKYLLDARERGTSQSAQADFAQM